MSWIKAFFDLERLHDTRRQMSYASIYHGSYLEEAVRLNKIILDATGKNYNEFSEEEKQELKEDAIFLSGG